VSARNFVIEWPANLHYLYGPGACAVTAHAVTMNGRISTELKPLQGRSVREELEARLELLDGKNRFSFLLWRLPAGIPFDQVDLDAERNEYIQWAGGVAGRFTCELRQLDGQGSPRQYVIGRAVDEGVDHSQTAVLWDDHRTLVRESEVLTLDEVRELFVSYFRRVPSLVITGRGRLTTSEQLPRRAVRLDG
jgi:hypothetical protein